jgi:hypothetical protein
VKFGWSVSFLVCSLIAASGVLVVSDSLMPAPSVLAASLPAQDAANDTSAAVDLSGTWQMSWSGQNGGHRQASMEIKQDGSKLSGSFDGQRGSLPLSGKLNGDQVSLTVKIRRHDVSFSGTVNGDKMSGATARGGTWTATRGQQQ